MGRSRTRKSYARAYRDHGYVTPSKFIWSYKLGEYVDIKINGAVHQGMPHRSYLGCSGLVWNVSGRALGVEIKKRVRYRILRKRIYLRIEHVEPSRCREDFLFRVYQNNIYKKFKNYPDNYDFNHVLNIIKEKEYKTNITSGKIKSAHRLLVKRQPEKHPDANCYYHCPSRVSTTTLPNTVLKHFSCLKCTRKAFYIFPPSTFLELK